MDKLSQTSTQALLMAYKKGYRVIDNKVLSPNKKVRALKLNHQGYYVFSMAYNGTTVHIAVHRLAAYQKFGDLLFSAQCVRHLDGNHFNNTPDNIELGTLKENSLDIPKEKRIKMAKHASSCQKNFNDDEKVIEIKKFYNETRSYKKTMEHFGISSKGTLYFILNKR